MEDKLEHAASVMAKEDSRGNVEADAVLVVAYTEIRSLRGASAAMVDATLGNSNLKIALKV
ncbi:hypothetical protein [Paraburkholderia aromaticivorans]|uniref:hypothetical protein n=1 Tax=Paraburkholderia aromaticivorans TaxID=2026199 RepID=UPI0014562093|nr:hypothetical protein [Paraburkholderia aromaticivorans]